MRTCKKLVPSQGGQALTELALVLPMLLVLALGAIEISNMIYGYLTLGHLTREAANMISRGIDTPDSALDAIIDSACPLIGDGSPCTDNRGQWEIIYSRVGPGSDPTASCGFGGNVYVVLEQVTKGELNEASKVGAVCEPVGDTELPDIDQISTGQSFYIVEAFYAYEVITPVGNMKVNIGNPIIFYDRAVF